MLIYSKKYENNLRGVGSFLFSMNKQLVVFCILLIIGSSACCISNTNNSQKKNENEIILKLSPETIESIGLKKERAIVKKVGFELKFNGIVKEVPNKTFFVASPVRGRIKNVFVNINQIVSRGQQLAEISSQDVAQLELDITKEQIDLQGNIEQAKLELELAKNSYERESELFQEGITPKKEFLEAENKYRIAQNNLLILEKKKESIETLAEKRLSILGAHLKDSLTDSGFVQVRSPGRGVILKRAVNSGEVVDENSVLFEASDLSEIFIESQIYEKDLSEISLGKKVTFTTEALPNSIFHGEINFISQTVEPQTRTIAIKAKILNPEFKLKPEMFGKMYINLSDKEALIVSKLAIQIVDNKHIAYVCTGDGFKEVSIQTGKETDGFIEIISGLKPNQEVVTQGSFWLKSELHTD